MQHKPGSIFEAAKRVLSEANEISPEDKKVIDVLKKALPTGSNVTNYSNEPKLSWEKRGGYAGEKSLKASREKLEKIGFKWNNGDLFGLPDGSTTGHGTYLVHKKLGWYAKIVNFYGQTKERNAYTITLGKLKAA